MFIHSFSIPASPSFHYKIPYGDVKQGPGCCDDERLLFFILRDMFNYHSFFFDDTFVSSTVKALELSMLHEIISLCIACL